MLLILPGLTSYLCLPTHPSTHHRTIPMFPWTCSTSLGHAKPIFVQGPLVSVFPRRFHMISPSQTNPANLITKMASSIAASAA